VAFKKSLVPDDDKNKDKRYQDNHEQLEECEALLVVLQRSHRFTHHINTFRIGGVGLSSQLLVAKLVQ
jgi:hypothetical protein